MSAHASTEQMRQNVRRALLLVSFLLFPVTFYYLSPYLIIMGAGERTASGSMVVFGVMTLTALVLGRLFCGWVCPAGGLGEALFGVQNRKANNRRDWTRWLVWVPWMAVVILVTLRAGGIERVDVPYQTDHGVSLTTAGGIGPYIVFYAVLALIFVLSLTAGRRGFCHHACWMAPFMMIGRGIRNALRLPAVQLRSNTPACVGCRACTTSPDEPRGLRDGPERANGEQRMHPVRYLR
jgi:ferredoxin-type protein NapH